MKKTTILYATLGKNDLERGFAYSTELAKTLGKDLYLLVVTEKTVTERLGDFFSAASLAEEGMSREQASELLSEGYVKVEAESDMELKGLRDTAKGEGVELEVYATSRKLNDAVSGFIKGRPGVEMVLLGPAVTAEGRVSNRELKKLVTGVGRPVVTMRPSEGGEFQTV